jgi:RNA polymerase sigma-70 factor (ECF subfamily)
MATEVVVAEVPPVETLLEHAAFARRLARALVGDAARADDVVQTSWLQALQHPPREGRGMKAWLAAVVRNAAARVRREEARRDQRERGAAVPERLPATVDVAAQLSAQRALLDAVARLDEPYRSTVHARFFEERTPTAIAAASGVPVRTVETRLRRAIARLRAELDGSVDGGCAAWAGALLGSSVVTAKAKVASVAGIGALLAASVVTLAVVVVRHGRGNEGAPSGVAAAAAAAPSDARGADGASAPASAPVPEGAREAATCTVQVAAPDGRAMEGTLLVEYTDDGVLAEATTDARGQARIPIAGAPCRLLAVPGFAPPRIVEVAAGAADVAIAFDDGVPFRGHVVVGSRPPPAPIELKLEPNALPFPPVDVPACVAESVKRRGSSLLPILRTRTDRGGGFAFFGLAPHLRVSLGPESPYECIDARGEKPQYALDDASPDVEVVLRVSNSIRGRLVDRSGAPLAGWKVETWTGSPDGESSQPVVASGEDGSFRAYVSERYVWPTAWATLWIREPCGVLVRRVRIDRSVDAGCDVGDLTVDTSRTVALVVRDCEGQAVQEFAVVVERKGEVKEQIRHPPRSLVTAAAARAGIVLSEEVASLRVVAPGFVTRDVPVDSAPGRVDVVLEPAAQLTLDLREGDGSPVGFGLLEIRADGWPGAWSSADVAVAHERLGGSSLWIERAAGDLERFLSFQRRSDGQFRALALTPGIPLALTVRDSLGVDVWHEEVVLAPGEAQVISETLSSTSRTISGFVHDPSGRPLPKTRVTPLTPGSSGLPWVETDAAGRFRIDAVRAGLVTLRFVARGHVWRWMRDLDADATSEPLDVELAAGCSLSYSFFGTSSDVHPSAVWMEDAALRPRPDAADLPTDLASRIDAEVVEDGSFFFADAMAQAHWIRASVDGFAFAWASTGEGGSQHNCNVARDCRVQVDWSVAAASSGAARTLRALRLAPKLTSYGVRVTLPLSPEEVATGRGVASFEKVPYGRFRLALVWSDASGAASEEATDVDIDLGPATDVRIAVAR